VQQNLWGNSEGTHINAAALDQSSAGTPDGEKSEWLEAIKHFHSMAIACNIGSCYTPQIIEKQEDFQHCRLWHAGTFAAAQVQLSDLSSGCAGAALGCPDVRFELRLRPQTYMDLLHPLCGKPMPGTARRAGAEHSTVQE